ncbi:hypothetical protein H1Q59_05505 [Holosporaceae bacterium 'Namur']|nr:hypothetical protein [Holosporaceae bacterium 'Namur']
MRINILLLAIFHTSFAYASQDIEMLTKFKLESEATAKGTASKIGNNFTNMENNTLKDHIGYEGTNIPAMHMPLEQAEGEGKKKREKVYDKSEEYICTKQDCEAGHTFSTKATLERETKMEEAGFIRDEDNNIRNNKGYLDKALKTVKEADEKFDFLTGGYTDCKPEEEGSEVKSEKTCDQYYDMMENTCFPKQVVEIDPKYTYLCNKKREVREKLCSDVIKKVKCKHTGNCNANGIVEGSIEPVKDIYWSYNYPFLIIGNRDSNNTWNGVCLKVERTINFQIKNRNIIEEFKLIRVGYDDYMRVTVNGKQVYIGPESGTQLEVVARPIKWWRDNKVVNTGTGDFACERSTNWKFNVNIDLKPFLVEGANNIKFEVVLSGGGEGWIEIIAQQHCCKDWEIVEREETCEFSS